MQFNRRIKASIFKIVESKIESIFADSSQDGMDFLGGIWNLREMSSQDGRYKDAYGDIYQHYVNNTDLSTEQLFVDRLQIYESDDVFKIFIERVLDPKYYVTPDEITNLSVQIDSELRTDKLRLVIVDYNDLGLPVNMIFALDEVNNLPEGVKKNNILFYVVKDIVPTPSTDEYFTLTPNKRWNDYSVVSGFRLVYHKSGQNTSIGHLKIIHKQEFQTWEHMPDMFTELTDDFCSSSGVEDYYFKIRDIFGYNIMISILFSLQDAALFSDIYDRFHKKYNFVKSIIRDDGAERILREMKAKLSGHSSDDLYGFIYRFRPSYSEGSIDVPFSFNTTEQIPNRIYAIIGKNGTGKTQLMTSLPNDFSKSNSDVFYDKIPAFSKIIAVSYSVFDTFAIPRKNASFNYVYCGLRNEQGQMRSDQSLLLSFHNNWKRILEFERAEKWRSVLLNFIDDSIVDSFIQQDNQAKYSVNIQEFSKIKGRLSSGQSILLFIITEVVSNIRYDSLILYDEPETHLHPNAIVQLMNTLYELVEEFESFCLIATHSPLVIRELFSRNVYILQRDVNTPSIRRIGLESFGENLGVLTDEVFGDREMPKQYKKIILEQIRLGKSFDEIVEMIEFDKYPLSLNARVFIKNMIRNEKL